MVLRCIEYSETSQVVAVSTPDLGQVHLLAKGSRRPQKNGRTPLDVLSYCDLVLSKRRSGTLHLLTGWSVRQAYPTLRKNLCRFWTAFYAAEVTLSYTSENPDDGPVCDHLVAFLRRIEQGGDERLALFLFLGRLLGTVGSAPVTETCAQCHRPLFGRTRFSPGAGGALCGDCGTADPSAFAVSRGALAVMACLGVGWKGSPALHITSGQAREIQRAFNEQIQYHLGKPLRTARFLVHSH